jgi:ligand-binding sensor domain-containing protein
MKTRLKMTRLTACLVLILLCLSCQKRLDLADPLETGKWKIYNSSNGLPGDFINDIFIDNDDNVWIAFISNGVTKYDGNTWTNYNTGNSNILSNYISCIEQDGDGDMWFGTNDGISILADGTTWYYYYDPNTVLNILSLKKDRNNRVWIGTENESYLYYQDSYIYNGIKWPIEDLNTINAIEEDENGKIWLGTDLGILKGDGSQWDLISMEDGLPDNLILALFLDSKNRMWISTFNGESISYSRGGNIYNLSIFNGYRYPFIGDICEDFKGDLWFATWLNGAVKYDGVIMESYKEYTGLLSDKLEAIAADKKGNVWFGTREQGVAKYSIPIQF